MKKLENPFLYRNENKTIIDCEIQDRIEFLKKLNELLEELNKSLLNILRSYNVQ